MDLVTVRQIYKDREQYLNKEISVGGWVRSLRDSKAFGFIVLSDGTYFETLQVVYHDTMDNFSEISRLSVGTALIIKGTLVATPEAKQPFEIQATEIVIAAKNPNPNEIKYEIADFLYHMMVLMAEKGVTWEEVTTELANR